jgi:hypothetical protein
MINPLLTNEFENKILELIDRKDDWTRSDLQGRVSAIVNEILVSGYRLITEMNKEEIAGRLGSLGGLATSNTYGKEHYQKLAENMNRKRREKKDRSGAR